VLTHLGSPKALRRWSLRHCERSVIALPSGTNRCITSFSAKSLHVLRKLDPKAIGLNYSTDDVTADGLTYGHWLLLQELLEGTPYIQRLTSASPLLTRLRGRKSHAEVGRIRVAVKLTEQIDRIIAEQKTRHA
jgi:Xaa-Pro aminopeptidase